MHDCILNLDGSDFYEQSFQRNQGLTFDKFYSWIENELSELISYQGSA